MEKDYLTFLKKANKREELKKEEKKSLNHFRKTGNLHALRDKEKIKFYVSAKQLFPVEANPGQSYPFIFALDEEDIQYLKNKYEKQHKKEMREEYEKKLEELKKEFGVSDLEPEKEEKDGDKIHQEYNSLHRNTFFYPSEKEARIKYSDENEDVCSEKKYYFPDKEEICVGLYCQIRPRINKGVIPFLKGQHEYKEQWVDHIIDDDIPNMIPNSIDDALTYLKDGALRVKYIDMQDFIDLGFEFKEKNKLNKSLMFQKNISQSYGHKMENNWYVKFYYETNFVQILKEDLRTTRIWFRGLVKSKTDFLKILKSSVGYTINNKK